MNANSASRLTTQEIRGRTLIAFVKAAIRQFRPSGDEFEDEDEEQTLFRLLALANALKVPTERAWAMPLSHVLTDLHRQGWVLSYSNNHIWGIAPDASENTRELIRARLSVRRDAQLSQPSVARFLKEMEAWRVHLGRRVSVVSLLRDGRELASALQGPEPSRAIQPYVQFVGATTRCEFTGLRLQDVWRYFRLTWSSPYESIPGRSLQLIVRDAAAENHPVMGIAALSSAAVRLGSRDRFIGWDTDHVIDTLRSMPVEMALDWSLQVVTQTLAETYTLDFVREGIFSLDHRQWTFTHSSNLRRIAEVAREAHHQLMAGPTYRSKDPKKLSDEDWAKQAELPLFRAKRAAELANLIDLKLAINRATTEDKVPADVLSRVVRLARSRTVGTEIADLTVCGAIAPYSHLAAGKLVALMSVSPAAIREYKSKYTNTPSIISSSVAGRAIYRAANLVYVGTTSLYGKRPNQYDRLSMPAVVLGGQSREQLRYQHIRDATTQGTSGVGTFQFAPDTLKALEVFGQSQNGGWRVNNVFGEGTSPKLRGLRDGFSAVGLDSDKLLQHGIEKCVYGVKLAENVDRYLLGIDATPTWLFDLDFPGGGMDEIYQWWVARWGLRRLQQSEVLDRIRREALIYPIRHAGRVTPRTNSRGQEDLFRE